MRVIPVIDLMQGQVVRGIAGRRDEYRAIVGQLAADAGPATVAAAFASRFGFDTVYVADLDAIQHGRPNVAAWQAIAGAGLALWLDAGVGTGDDARRLLSQLTTASLKARIVVGLESLDSADELERIVEACLPQRAIFSLDLKRGEPLSRSAFWQGRSAGEIALLAHDAGIDDLIVLDLADVGTNSGTRSVELCRQLRASIPNLHLIAGGGVRGPADLRTLAAAGCDAALVASALHDGRLCRDDLAAIETLHRGADQ
ncbi:MAG: HisA/HisF-related TIM barrel protein [Pirellulaceae bacterium]